MSKVLRWLQFNIWYLRQPPWDTGITPPEVMSFLQHQPPGRALDLGCGTGTNLLTLAQHGWQVVGVDFARQAVRKARQKIRRSGYQAELHNSDVSKLDFLTQPFDYILDVGCLHGITPSTRRAYFDTVQRLLKPGGVFMLYAFFQESDSAIGLRQSDVDELYRRFKCREVVEGMERKVRRSAWFTFEKS